MTPLYTYQPRQGPGHYVADALAVPKDALADGSYNVLVQPGNFRIWKGMRFTGAGARQLFRVFEGYAGLIDNDDTEANGSVFNYIANSLFWIGEGLVTYNGEELEDFTATSNLQLSPHPYEEAFTAGMAQPDAPIVEARSPSIIDPEAGLMNGLYSFKIARVRSLTGGRSIASPTSAVIPFTGQTARLTFPLADSNGQDRWAVFATKAGFGGTGVHYLVQEIADEDLVEVDSVARSYEFNIVDADLLPVTAYIDDYPPPAGDFGGRIENYVVVVGAYENAIAISIRNFPESFHPEHLAFLPKAPTAVLQDQFGSYLYISCEDSIHALSVAPSAYGNPMILQTISADTGVDHNHAWCSVDGVLFAFVSKQGAVAMDPSGKLSSEFAVPVAKAMKEWSPADTVVLHAPNLKSVFFCNRTVAYGFNYVEMKWSAPVRLYNFGAGNIVSGVIQDRELYITMEGSTLKLYQFDREPDSGTGTSFAYVSPDVQVNPEGRVNITNTKATFAAPDARDYTLKVIADDTTKTLTHTVSSTGLQHTKLFREGILMFRKNVLRCELEGRQVTFANDCHLASVEVFGSPEMSSQL